MLKLLLTLSILSLNLTNMNLALADDQPTGSDSSVEDPKTPVKTPEITNPKGDENGDGETGDQNPDWTEENKAITAQYFCALQVLKAQVSFIPDHLNKYGLPGACYTSSKSNPTRDYVYNRLDAIRLVDIDLGDRVSGKLYAAENAGLQHYFEDLCFQDAKSTEKETKDAMSDQAYRWIAISDDLSNEISDFFLKTYKIQLAPQMCGIL